jgi:putative oxidoreductase
MSPIRRVARPLLATAFLTGGLSALRQPGPRVELVRAAGLSSPEKLVRANAATDVLAGLALATNRLPRLSSLVLAGSLVPTTVVGHAFWSEKDKVVRKQQQTHFVKNLGVLGGLLLAVADTGGRESVPHATGRLSRKARKDLATAAGSAHTSAGNAHKAAGKAARDLRKDARKQAAKAQKSVVKAQARAAKALPTAS